MGLTNERDGELVLPIGTLYDPFIRRGLDALVYSLQSGGKFIFVGTFIGLVGYVMAPEGDTPHELWDPVMWIGSGIGIFGWLWGAFRG